MVHLPVTGISSLSREVPLSSRPAGSMPFSVRRLREIFACLWLHSRVRGAVGRTEPPPGRHGVGVGVRTGTRVGSVNRTRTSAAIQPV